MPRRSLGILSLALLALACERAPTGPSASTAARALEGGAVAASASGPSVTGAGTITFGSSKEHLSVSAFGTTGHAVFHDEAAGGNFHGQIDINCVRIVGNEATISGIVSHSNNPTLEGMEALFQIRDNGNGGSTPDLMSPILFHTVGVGPDCLIPSEFDVVPVRGNFNVRP
jgi:hypothetical protein